MITNISRDWGSDPCLVRVTTTDDLATITAPLYLDLQRDFIRAINNGDFQWSEGDQVLIDFSGGSGLFKRNSVTNTFVLISADGGFVTFTPAITFATPGNLTVVYGTRTGIASKNGSVVDVRVSIQFTPTHTTAAGNFLVTGFPFTVQKDMGGYVTGIGSASHLTYPTGRTALSALAIESSTTGVVQALGSATADAILTTAQFTTATAFQIDATYRFIAV